MSVPAVSNQIDQEILPEFRAILDSEPCDTHTGVGMFGVHVDDRDFEALREVARVTRRSSIGRVGSEPDLIVGDDVKRSPNPIRPEPRHVERLGNYAFTRKRRVTVNRDWNNRRFVSVLSFREE